MKIARVLLYLVLLALAAPGAFAAEGEVTWKARLEPPDARAGEAAQVVVEGRVDAPWHIYSLAEREGPGPRPTKITVPENAVLAADGNVVQPAPKREYDKGFKMDVELFGPAVAFGVPVRLADGVAGAQKVELEVRWQACKDGMCLRPMRKDVPVEFTVAGGAARPERQQPVRAVPTQPEGYTAPEGGAAGTVSSGGQSGGAGTGIVDTGGQIKDAQSKGLLAFLGLSILMGFLALLTPCVFPMVPITVSYFTKQQEIAPTSGIKGAVAYCLGIILTFTLLGVLTSLLFGAGTIANIATHPLVNLALAALFIVLAFNLFGAFEIQMPSWLVAKTSEGSQKGGLVGPVLMGLTFTLTSFTCTFAFVGALLATTAQGNVFWPMLGMLGFSTAFASPFFLLALFPQWLAKLPKSGSWLVTVKGFMGFLELAAALKFLSNADLVWQLGVLTRPVFLALWFAIFAIAGFYMLGLLRLPHDADGGIGPFRRTFGILSLAVGVGCLALMNSVEAVIRTPVVGFAMAQFVGFLPPRVYPGQEEHVAEGGLLWHEDYEKALAQAQAENKPIFIDFTGVTCTNCRVMEDTVFTEPAVIEEFKKFVTVRLYTDKEDAQSERYAKMQLDRFGQTTLPLYVVTTPDEKKLAERDFNPPDAKSFVSFLQRAQAQATETASAQ